MIKIKENRNEWPKYYSVEFVCLIKRIVQFILMCLPIYEHFIK